MGINLVNARSGIPGNAFVWAASSFVLVGAMFFGFGSCGGYEWHKEAFRALAVVAAIVAVVAPSPLLRSIVRKAAFLVGLVVGFHLVEATVAPFYPGPPESLRQYGALFLASLEFGPCR